MDHKDENARIRDLLLLVDDDPLLRNVTSWSLASGSRLQPLEAATLAEARQLIARFAHDIRVTVLDYQLTDGCGLDLVPVLRNTCPRSQILVYTGYVHEASQRLLAHPSIGLIPKGRDPRYLQQAVSLSADLATTPPEEPTGSSVPLRVAGRALPNGWFLWELPRRVEWLMYTCNLTHKELDVALLVAKGHSNQEVANTLKVSEGAVKARLAKLYRKLDLGRRAHLELLFR